MTDDELQTRIADQYRELADLLEALPAERWETPSLCERWRVREVVAHMTMAARYDQDAFMAELRADEFDFTRLSNRIAERDGARPHDELIRNLRDDVLHRWMPPGGGVHGALNHVVIHSLDITAALGEPRIADDDLVRVLLDDLTAGGGHERFGVDITGRELQATDIDWSYGSGAPLRDTAQALALRLCGRKDRAGAAGNA
jgi:uncharacterized protein (TIGR03083 family)